MQLFEVMAQKSGVDFAPANVYEEVLQNIRTILATPRFSVALDRGFGIEAALLDAPLAAAQARLTAEIIAALQTYEPRAEVLRVRYEGDAQEGILQPKVQVKIRGT